MTSMLLFASVSLAAMTYLVVRLTGARRGWSLVPRVLLAGVLTPPTMAIAGLPSSLFAGNTTAQAWILGVELALVWLAGGWIVVAHLMSPDREPDEPLSAFARIYPAVYLGVLAAFWLSALPAYLAAGDDDTSIGSGPYALACFLGAGLLLAALRGTHHGLRWSGRGRWGAWGTTDGRATHPARRTRRAAGSSRRQRRASTASASPGPASPTSPPKPG
jgi:hypothetical protein